MDIYIPKFKEIYAGRDYPIIGPKASIEGKVKFTLRGSDGRIKYESHWQNNLITDIGLAELRYSDWMSHLVLGSGTTPPAVTDTQIEVYLGDSSGDFIPNSMTNTQAPDYIRTTVKDYVFANGEATGTISELGFSPKDSPAPYKLTTHLLLDTPIVKGPNDHLTVTYQIILHPPLVDATGVIDIGGEDFNYTMRASNLDDMADATYPSHPYMGWVTPDYRNRLLDGSIGSITEAPLGNANSPAGANITYGGGVGNYYADLSLSVGIDDNNGTTIKSIWSRLPWGAAIVDSYTVATGYQVEIGRVADGPLGLAGTGILKLDTHVFGITLRQFSDRWP